VTQGRIGETYNVGGKAERRNIDIVHLICATLDKISPAKNNVPYDSLIEFVTDRPGHDFRYAIDSAKIEKELNWRPSESFESGIGKTVTWYVQNRAWCDALQNKKAQITDTSSQKIVKG
jgi:dTDP-glucose 4,6-dehydratase